MTRVLAAALFIAVAACWQPSSTQAHGTFDQGLEGDPGCNTSNFGGSVTAPSGQRQSFTPTGTQLISVALCVSAGAPDTPLVVAIYTAGGALVGGGSTAQNPSIPDAAGPTVRFVHVDFIQPYAVTPGATYVIENVSGTSITWYGTTAASPYTYCQGEPNTTSVVDFGFQSFLVDSPGTPGPCIAPPTSTPVPPVANTPVPPTSTPAPGETVAPTSTAVPGTTPQGQGTPPSGQTTAGEEAPPPSGNSALSAGTAGSGASPSGLPGSGTGSSDPADGRVSWQLALVCAGAGLAMLRLAVGRRPRGNS